MIRQIWAWLYLLLVRGLEEESTTQQEAQPRPVQPRSSCDGIKVVVVVHVQAAPSPACKQQVICVSEEKERHRDTNREATLRAFTAPRNYIYWGRPVFLSSHFFLQFDWMVNREPMKIHRFVKYVHF